MSNPNSAPSVSVEVSATDATRIEAGAIEYNMKRAALLGCHDQVCQGVVAETPLEAGRMMVCVACTKPGCEVIVNGSERLGLGIASTAKHFGAQPSKKR